MQAVRVEMDNVISNMACWCKSPPNSDEKDPEAVGVGDPLLPNEKVQQYRIGKYYADQ